MPQRLAQHLIARGLLTASTVDEALRQMAKNGGSLDTNLLEMSAISEAGLLQAISDVSGVRLVNLADFEPNPEAGPLMPFKMARQLGVVPLSVDGIALHLACSYPMPQNQLKDVGFLLGRKLELWVSLEVRVKQWQSLIYTQPLEARLAQLIAALDPPKRISNVVATAEMTRRAISTDEHESLSSEVLERIARGIIDEPVLLSSPKKNRAPSIALGEDFDESKTSVVEPTAYSRFAKATTSQAAAHKPMVALGDGDGPATLEVPPPEGVETATQVLNTAGYEKFARESAGAPEMPTGIRFPGGVAPPRRATPEPEAPRAPTRPDAWVRPAIANSPGSSRSTQSTAVTQALPPPRAPARTASAFDQKTAVAHLAHPTPPSKTTEPAPTPHQSLQSRTAISPAVAASGPGDAAIQPQARTLAPPPPPATRTRLETTPRAPPPPATGTRLETTPRAPPPPATETRLETTPRAPPPPATGAQAPTPSAGPSHAIEARRASPEPAPSTWGTKAAPVEPPSRFWETTQAEAGAPGSSLVTDAKETDFSDVDSTQRPEPTMAAPAFVPQHPSPVPSRSEPWQMLHTNASLTPPPTPLAPAVPLAGVNLTSGDPNILASPPGLSPASASEWTLAQARQSLKVASQDRDQLVSVMLDYGRRTFEYIGAFAVMRGAAYGWDARGDGDLTQIRQLTIPLDAASVFRTVALTRGSYVGPLPPDALSQHYLALLGRSPRTVLVWPIEVQSRLVAILYGDCGARPVSQRRLSDFILFCQDLPTAFHDLIVFRKLNPRAPPAYEEPAAPTESAPSDVPTDADWFHGLMSLLTGPDPAERAMAMSELLKTPRASAIALAAAFPGPTGWSRLPVVELPEPDELGPIPGALARLGALGATALAPLLDSADSDTRYLALLTAGSLRYPDVVDGVLRGLFDLEPDISSAARSSAAWLQYLPLFQQRMPDLRQELAASDPLRRSLAARALGVLHDREAIDGLINLTGSEDELCATSAAEALKEVTRASFGTNPRAWSAWYAGARSKRRIEWLVEALQSDDFDLRLSAIEELSRTFGDHHGFFADGPKTERSAAIEKWQEMIAERSDLEL